MMNNGKAPCRGSQVEITNLFCLVVSCFCFFHLVLGNSPQVPGNLSSRPEHVVLAYKLPYNENLAPKELEKEDNTDYFGKVINASTSASERRQ